MIRVLSIIANTATQLFLPLEHIVWAADSRIVSCQSRPWMVTALVVWLISLVSNILKYVLRHVSNITDEYVEVEHGDSKCDFVKEKKCKEFV